MGSSMSIHLPHIYIPPASRKTQATEYVKTTDGMHVSYIVYEPYAMRLPLQAQPPSIILFSHGNGDDISTCSSYCTWLAEVSNSTIVAYDYFNYGNSDSVPTTEENMQQAIWAIFSRIMETYQTLAPNIWIFGKSLGSVPSIWLASRRNKHVRDYVKGLVLVSPIASGARVEFDPRYIPTNVLHEMDKFIFPNINRVHDISSKIIIFHGTEDTTVPYRNGESLSEQCKKCIKHVQLVPCIGCDHNNIEFRMKTSFETHLKEFMNVKISVPSSNSCST